MAVFPDICLLCQAFPDVSISMEWDGLFMDCNRLQILRTAGAEGRGTTFFQWNGQGVVGIALCYPHVAPTAPAVWQGRFFNVMDGLFIDHNRLQRFRTAGAIWGTTLQF